MLRRLRQAIWVALFACFLFVVGSFAWSISHQPVPQQQNKRASETQANSKSIAPPTIISLNELHTKHTDKKSETEKQDFFTRFFEFNITDLLLAIFTGVLAYKTSGLFRETAALRAAADKQATDMLRSIKAAEKAAETAILNADAFMNSEGAQLWMDEVKVHGIRTAPDALKLTYVVRNFGNSPGWVHHKPTMIITGNSLPADRILDQTSNPEINFVPARHSTNGEAPMAGIIAQPRIDALLVPNPTDFMFIYGSINYRDIFRRERRAGFAYKIVFGGGNISESSIIAGGPAYWDYQ